MFIWALALSYLRYHFTTREAMEAAIVAGEFIETAEFGKNLYGTSKKAVKVPPFPAHTTFPSLSLSLSLSLPVRAGCCDALHLEGSWIFSFTLRLFFHTVVTLHRSRLSLWHIIHA